MILRPLVFQEGQSLSATFLRVSSGVSVVFAVLSRRFLVRIFDAKGASLQRASELSNFEDKMSGLNF